MEMWESVQHGENRITVPMLDNHIVFSKGAKKIKTHNQTCENHSIKRKIQNQEKL